MRKYSIFSCLVIFFALLFLIWPEFIFSQEITPTPEPGKLGGRCKVVSKEEINSITESVPKFNSPDDKEPGKWGCLFDYFGFQFGCLSDLFNSAKSSVNEFLDTEQLLENLGELVACDPGLEPKIDIKKLDDIKSPDCICVDPNTVGLTKISDYFCNKYIKGSVQEKNKSNEFLRCSGCFSDGGYYSGIGCIYFGNWKDFFEKNVFGTLIGLAGFIALVCIIYSAFQLQFSQGNAEKIKKSQELLTSCIMGLMLIIFSVFILRVIGVDLLKIPGFGK